MYKVKEEYQDSNIVVCVEDKTLITKGLKSVINLTLATQKELAYLYKMGERTYIEEVVTKKSK